MKILIVSQFFPPEMGAPAARFFDFARHWIEAGHEVSVITAFPNWPQGQIHEQYRGKFYQKETTNGIETFRGFIYIGRKLNLMNKIIAYCSFLISSSLIILLKRIECDVVISTSPPPLVGFPGILASRLKKVPMVFDVRDIWPESPAQIGMVKNRPLIRLLEWIESLLYRSSHLISVVTHGKIGCLVDKRVPEDKITLVRSGVDLSLFDAEAVNPLPDDLDKLLSDYLCFTYAGVLNVGQGLDVILDTARRLRDQSPDLYQRCAFLLIGDGPVREQLENRKRELDLDHVFLMGIRTRSEVFSVLKRSYATLVTLCLRPDTHTVPSKLYEAMAPGRPVLVCAEGEPADIITQAGGGTVCLPGSVDQLTQAVRNYLDNPELADRHGQTARKYCEAHFDRRDIALRFLDTLSDLVKSR